MKILLYGGTFDPPHNGHLHNLKHSAQCVRPDHVIVMPAGVPPHKRASETSGETRLQLCDCFQALLADGSVPSLAISDWEIQQAARGEKNYTVHTLEMLHEKYPTAALSLCIGSDMLLIFTTWYRWQDILSLATLVIESREAGDADALQAVAKSLDPSGERILFADAPPLPMASNALRAKLAKGEDCSAFLPPSVQAQIQKEGLYVETVRKA
ncbi:MAG: nicotinate (nicotinamide) nucleotide adenylyltransferase [Faecalibacterium sp.]